MKNQLIATLVGALILFFWQFLSWSALNIHGAEQSYTPQQEKVLQALSDVNLEEGHYFLPTVPPGSSASEHQAVMEANNGKPWARLSYYSKMETNMGMNLFRGFVIDLLAVFLLTWILMQFSTVNLTNGVMASLAVGIIGYTTIPYLNSIWFDTPTIGYIIDTFVQWGLVGIWLGWFLKK